MCGRRKCVQDISHKISREKTADEDLGQYQNGSSRIWIKSVEWIQKDQHNVQWWAFVSRIKNVRCHFLTVVLIKTQVSWDKMLCQLVNWYTGADISGQLAASSFQVQVVHWYYLYHLTT
jgi:hypothetical protein